MAELDKKSGSRVHIFNCCSVKLPRGARVGISEEKVMVGRSVFQDFGGTESRLMQ